MNIWEARDSKGKRVRYSGTGEFGVITSCSETMVFVRYGDDGGSKATYPADLELVEE